jgi:hypothetical protein
MVKIAPPPWISGAIPIFRGPDFRIQGLGALPRVSSCSNCFRMKHDRPTCTQQIVLRVPSDLRNTIESAASAEGRTLANMARHILNRWATERQPRHGEQAA